MKKINRGGSAVSNRVFCFVLSAVLVALCVSVEAQQAKRVPRIGYLEASGDPRTPGHQIEAFRQGLQDLGYIEEKNILIEYRYAEGKLARVPGLVSELVQLKPDVLVLISLPSIRTAEQATKVIPIVMVIAVDPVATGLVDSLARPGANITGIATLTKDLSGKRLELLMELVPGLSRLGVLWDANAPAPAIGFKEYEAVARPLKIQIHSLEVRSSHPDFERLFQAAAKGRVNALITISNPVLRRYPKQIADLAIKSRLPSMHEGSPYVEAGGLMAYATKGADSFRRAAYYVDGILKGAKPSDLPVEQPKKFELVINLKTAEQIGLTIPQWTLMKADRVIK